MSLPAAASNVTPIDPAARELAAVADARANVKARLITAQSARSAAATDPARVLAEAKLALDREMHAAAVAEHEIVADAAYFEGIAKYGHDGVMRIATRDGSIVIRRQTEQEEDAAEDRAQAHLLRAERTPAGLALAERNATMARNLAIAEQLVLTPRAHFDRTLARHHRLWPTIWAARNALSDARIFAEGKGVGG